ncbi:MAG: hypothetical protein JO311_05495, partial [Candidatus Eremiobacteraeota bacterium]|nr:hypothetical protein [Candidatus Eremiobacteraeota bacterium]
MTINVKGYGAVGNGVTDDALAINTALLASSATGQEVFFPPGTYLLGATLTVGPGTHLKLTGNAASIKFASNTRAAIQLSVLTGTGTSLAVSSGTVTLTAAASVFTAAHVGRTLVINSATNSANNGIFVVASYVSATQITYANASGVNETSSFTWSLATQDISIRDLGFQGDSSDDYTVNTNPAILIVDNVSDIEVFHCTFDHCTPIMANDSYVSRRLQFVGNYVHNAPNGLHPPSDSSITDSDFVCDSIVSTRAQAIYSYGQQTNLLIANCRFKNIAAETIQIRASASRYQLRNGFRIVGNHFETCDSYAVWVGSDDHPDIGETVISNNTFRNCNGPIQAQGNRSVV